MKGIFTIIKKEFKRFLTDKRFVFSSIILPGLLIFVMYSIMGGIISEMSSVDKDYVPTACVVNCPNSLSSVINASYDLQRVEDEGVITDMLKDGKLDLYVKFPADFDSAISSNQRVPNVEIYYNSGETKSSVAFTSITAILDAYETSLVNKFNVNADLNTQYDVSNQTDLTMKIMSSIMPTILLSLIFSGCMPAASESITGEKERGTLATLLITPVKRSHIAIGKIIVLSVVGIMSGASSALGLILSLPKLLGSQTFNYSMYSVLDYLSIFGVVISTVLVIISLISIISAFAKSIKETNSLVMPLMLVILGCGMSSMFIAGEPSLWLSLIPIFNSSLAISSVMSGVLNSLQLLITIGINLGFAAILVFVLTLMFKSEKIMFNN